MSYLNFNEYHRKWIFTHHSMPVDESLHSLIKPMTAERSAQFWKENLSAQSPDSERFSNQDWPTKTNSWFNVVDWMSEWESDDNALPEEILQHIDWQDDVTVYFCYEKYNVIETKWFVFKQNWKNFLFYDDGPILLARRRKQALWFASDGSVKLGEKS
ncbi:DUF2947 domain-containing protein [Vibrio sp. MA40-2]|uniref:DUF2947 domain-containing protein n=1 Tax=Vibrio sp. MA40-2 TaxID=3391828 RepID=UPI0039A55E98